MTREMKGLCCYILSWVGGLIIFLTEKDDELLKFHAVQSMIISGFVFAVRIAYGMIPIYIPMLSSLLSILQLVVLIVGCVKGYKLERFKFPIAGDMAENIIKNNA